MKIAILCDSLLLKNSLEIFLKDYISSYKNCDIVISDKKIDTDKLLAIISSSSDADIKKPFSKSSLLIDLKKIYKKENNKTSQIEKLDNKKDIGLIKEFYEK